MISKIENALFNFGMSRILGLIQQRQFYILFHFSKNQFCVQKLKKIALLAVFRNDFFFLEIDHTCSG
jgi:hypothetical protein